MPDTALVGPPGLPAASGFATTDVLYGVVGGKSRGVSGATLAAGLGLVFTAGKTLTLSKSLTVSGNDGTLSFGASGKILTVNKSLTLDGADGKTLTVSNSLTLAGTDGTTMTFPAASDTVAGLGTAQTFTAQNTFAAGTITTSQPLTLTQTWNAAGVTFTGLLVNVTNSASAATSKPFDVQVGGNSLLSVFSAPGISAGYVRLFLGGTSLLGLGSQNANVPDVMLQAGGAYGWSTSADPFSGTYDLWLLRDAAGVLALRNGVSAQRLRVYGSFTDSSNGDWLELSKAAGGAAYLRTVKNGSGVAGALGLGTAGTNYLTIDALGNVALGTAAIATTATDGFLYAVSGAGTPTGVPTSFTGRVPIYVDTTNSQLWMYLGGAWKQPKTPSGAALVTWQ